VGKNSKSVIIFASILLLVASMSGCSDDPPTKQQPAKDYAIYCWNTADGNLFYRYYPNADKLDSFYLPYYPWRGMVASADGSRLYINLSDHVEILETEGMTSIGQINHRPWGVVVSPDNQWLVVQNDTLWVYRTSDYSIVYTDTSHIVASTFSKDSRYLWGTGGDSTRYVYHLDVTTWEKQQRDMPGGAGIVIPSADESVWYLYTFVMTFVYKFEAYDATTDSILFRDWQVPSYGGLAITPDGRYVLYTYGGTQQEGPPIPSEFTVFDTRTNRIKMKVSTVGVKNGIDPDYMPINEMAMTPDGKWLILGDSHEQKAFVVFDIEKMEIVRYRSVRPGTMFYTCQNGK
jgi:DNA-binding beta-propeller fold protein YncE